MMMKSLNTGLALAFALVILCASLLHAQDGFRVTLLGTGTPKLRIERFGPSTLVEAGDEKLLFDCGRGTTMRLQQRNVQLRDVTAVFLTHLHSDHTVGIPDLWLTRWLGAPTGAFRIWGPSGTSEMMANLEKAFKVDIGFRTEDEKLSPPGVAVLAVDIAEGVVYEKNGVKVTAFYVDHGAAIKPAFGYRIDYRGRSAVISGDTRYSENLIKFSRGANLLIHEVFAAQAELVRTSDAVRRISAHHISPEDAGRVFESVKPGLAVYSHLGLQSTPRFPEVTVQEIIARTRQTYNGPLEVGEDLMSIDVGDSIIVHRPAPSSR
jgi:ribonuclease Z